MNGAPDGPVTAMIGAAGEHAARIEALWWPVLWLLLGVYALVMLALTVLSVLTDKGLAALAGGEELTIEVTPQQWWWQVRYKDEANPGRGFDTANEIHVPVGTRVRIELKGRDVIHSF